MAAVLTVDTVTEFVAKHVDKVGFFTAVSKLSATEIEGGNLNYAFCVRDETGKAVFVKQAPDFIKVFGPEAKLHRERLELEVSLYNEWVSMLGEKTAAEYLPNIYFCDLESMSFIMEFLESFQLLDKKLCSSDCETGLLQASQCLGEFMALVHSKSHSSVVGSERASELTKRFENRALRDIQLAYVFTKAFEESERAAWLRSDTAFMQELEEVRSTYNGQNTSDLALCHGDLHPGSVMVKDDGAMRVIDPEFCIYGPPGLDLGSLLSGYVLACIYHIASGNAGCATALRASIEKVWSSYSDTFRKTEASSPGIDCDCLAFISCEVARTSLGFAGVRGLPIEDSSAKAKAEEQALVLAHKCLMGRKSASSPCQLLLDELDRISSTYTS